MKPPMNADGRRCTKGGRRGTAPATALRTCLLGLLLLGLTACGTPQTTRLQVEDFTDMAQAMAQSLLQSPALAERTPETEPWIVSIQQVTNLSGDVIPQREQWALMAMLRGSLPMQQLQEQANVRFVLPAARVQAYRLSETYPEFEDFGADRQPTHVMTATIRSLVRAHARQRTDLYYAEFEILDLASGQPVWTDRFEFQREAFGAIRD